LEIPADWAPAHPNISALSESRADYPVCGHDSHYPEYRHVVLISTGGGIGSILDASNGAALTALYEAWELADREADDAPAWGPRESSPLAIHHGFYDHATVCADPLRVAPSVLALIIDAAERYAEYPLLDESDYSARELEEFTQCFADESFRVHPSLDESHPLYADALRVATENYLGYSDAGYISRQHVIASWVDAADSGADSPRCAACGDVADYCAGHGEIGDPSGHELLAALYGDEDDQ